MEISITNLIENFLNKSFNNEIKKNGSEMHKIFENYLKYKKTPKLDLKENKKIFKQFKNFLNFFLVNNKFLETEKKIIYKKNNKKIIGIIDAIFVNKDNSTYYIIDWKISYDFSFKKKNELTYILNAYSYMLEKEYKKEINIKMFLVLFHPLHENFVVLPIEKINKNIIMDLFN